MKFEDLDFNPHPILNGIKAEAEFPNGFGASVIKGPFSFGGEAGFYELAVLKDGKLCFDTDVAHDVEGWLKPEDVTRLLQQIESLDADGHLPK